MQRTSIDSAWSVMLMVLLLSTTERLAAQCLSTESGMLLPTPTPQTFSNYPPSISVHGSVAVLGASSETVSNQQGAGAVYVFRFNGSSWQQEARFVEPSPTSSAYFGRSVATDGSVILVGTSWASAKTYAYRYNGATWVFEQLLIPTSAVIGAYGFDVTVDGDLAAVGSPEFDGFGAAYMFAYNGTSWVETQRKTGNGTFGSPVKLGGGRLMVGAYTAGPPANSGKVYVYRLDAGTWNLEQVLVANDPTTPQNFGYAIDLDGDAAVIGAYRDSQAGIDAGAGYVFRRTGTSWSQEQKLMPSSAQTPYAGKAVAIAGDLVLVSARAPVHIGGLGAVARYRFSGTEWFFESWLRPSVGDVFELGVDAYGTIAVFASQDLTPATLFDVAPKDCNQNTFPDSVDLGTAQSDDCQPNCTPDECDIVDDDCNENLIPDACDLSSGLATDCNVNLALDVCDIEMDSSLDCNGDGAIDRCPVPVTMLPGEVSERHFGQAVSCSSERIAVGVLTPDNGYMGRVDVFHRTASGWFKDAVVADDVQAGDHFGTSVVLQSNRLLVGAPYGDSNGDSAGSAYVFRLEGTEWVLEQKLESPAIVAGDRYGTALAMRDPYVAVGASSGRRVHIFERQGTQWLERARLQSPSGGAIGGGVISIDLDRVAVSETSRDEVHIFERVGTEWPFVDTIPRPARSLDLQGDDLLIGARTGSAYWYEYDGADWQQRLQIDNPDPASSSSFAYSLARSGLTLVVGALGGSSPGFTWRPGRAYVYRRDALGWNVESSVAGSLFEIDAFGAAMALDRNLLAVGAPYAAVDGTPEAGIVYVTDVSRIRSPAPEPDGMAKNRFITFTPHGTCGAGTAVRVELRELNRPAGTPDFSAHEGEFRYLNTFKDAFGDPVFACPDSAGAPPYYCARLGCEPEYRDWGAAFAGQTVHVTGPSVVPGSWYDAVHLADSCVGVEDICSDISAPFAILTAAWGDVQADGLSVLDVAEVVDKLKEIPGALPEYRLLLQPNEPDPVIQSTTVLEVARVVEALKEFAYPFDGPVDCP